MNSGDRIIIRGGGAKQRVGLDCSLVGAFFGWMHGQRGCLFFYRRSPQASIVYYRGAPLSIALLSGLRSSGDANAFARRWAELASMGDNVSPLESFQVAWYAFACRQPGDVDLTRLQNVLWFGALILNVEGVSPSPLGP